MYANSLRGEVEIVLDKKSYALRPTFEALYCIEQELNMGFLALAKKIAAGNVTHNELAAIIGHCLADPNKLSRDILCESIAKGDVNNALASVAVLCIYVLNGFHYE